MGAARKYVVLGHTGFLGRSLVSLLQERKAEVHGFSRSTLDLRRRESLSVLDGLMSRDAVLVLNASLTPEHCKDLDGFAENVAMAANVARYLENHAVGKLVYVSTDAVYPMIDRAVTEETPPDPDNYYSVSKLAAERLLQVSACQRNQSLLIVRPSGIYGPGDTHNVYGPNRFVRSIMAEKRVSLFGEGEDRRDHVFVDDVAGMMLRLIEADASGTFNLVTGRAVRFAEIVAILQKVVPFAFSVTNVARQRPLSHREYDTSRFRSACPGYACIDLEEGLRRLVEHSLKENRI